MKITEVKIYPVAGSEKVKALVSVTLDGCLVVTGLKIVQGADDYFVGMPNRKAPSGEYKDIVFPVTKEFRADLQKAVLDKFEGKEDKQDNGEFITIDDTNMDLPF